MGGKPRVFHRLTLFLNGVEPTVFSVPEFFHGLDFLEFREVTPSAEVGALGGAFGATLSWWGFSLPVVEASNESERIRKIPGNYPWKSM